mgnify:CR=1 FL=1
MDIVLKKVMESYLIKEVIPKIPDYFIVNKMWKKFVKGFSKSMNRFLRNLGYIHRRTYPKFIGAVLLIIFKFSIYSPHLSIQSIYLLLVSLQT